jgi:hypothetical protein
VDNLGYSDIVARDLIEAGNNPSKMFDVIGNSFEPNALLRGLLRRAEFALAAGLVTSSFDFLAQPSSDLGLVGGQHIAIKQGRQQDLPSPKVICLTSCEDHVGWWTGAELGHQLKLETRDTIDPLIWLALAPC